MPAPGRPDGLREERRADRTRLTIQGLRPHRSSRAAHRSPPHRAAVQMKTIEVPLDLLLSRRLPGSRTFYYLISTAQDAVPRSSGRTPEIYFRAASNGLMRSPDLNFSEYRMTCLPGL